MLSLKVTSIAKFFLLLFVFAQVLVASHAMDHGSEEHEHNSQTCEFYLYAEKNHAADIGGDITLQLAAITYNSPKIFALLNVLSYDGSLSFARAPPRFS